MLSPDCITREELYEAVWSEPVWKLAAALGVSDVGLAKICKKLHVPRPERGYWMKSWGARKLLRASLPPLEPGQVESHRICLAATKGGAGWTREALRELAEEGQALPELSTPGVGKQEHPLIAAYRPTLEREGKGVTRLLTSKPCLAVAVSPELLDRSLQLCQQVFEACEGKGFLPEVVPPGLESGDVYGYRRTVPSRTGVRIKGVLVAFELTEQSDGGTKGLVLQIVDPSPYGTRLMWRDGKVQRLESHLNAFLRTAMAIAEREHLKRLEQERLAQAQEEAERKQQEEDARRAELAGRLYDLESRLSDMQQAEAIRRFVHRVRQEAPQRGLALEGDAELPQWLRWAEGLADQLESEALTTWSPRRERPAKPKSTSSSTGAEEVERHLLNEVDLWRRRYVFGR